MRPASSAALKYDFPIILRKRNQRGRHPDRPRQRKELFYASADGQLSSAILADQGRFTIAPPKPLFPATRGFSPVIRLLLMASASS